MGATQTKFQVLSENEGSAFIRYNNSYNTYGWSGKTPCINGFYNKTLTLPDGTVIKSKSYSCSTDCKVSDWTIMGPCSAKCGGGFQTRSRTITQNPSFGGRACPSLIENIPCNNQPCPRDCMVSNWSEWSPCDKKCDGGFQVRNRGVIQDSAFGGQICPQLVEIQACNTQDCVSAPSPSSIPYQQSPDNLVKFALPHQTSPCPNGTLSNNGVCTIQYSKVEMEFGDSYYKLLAVIIINMQLLVKPTPEENAQLLLNNLYTKNYVNGLLSKLKTIGDIGDKPFYYVLTLAYDAYDNSKILTSITNLLTNSNDEKSVAIRNIFMSLIKAYGIH